MSHIEGLFAADFRLVPSRVVSQAYPAARRSTQALNMDDQTDLKRGIKAMMVENLMLKVAAEDIGDEQALFGAGLGLDSVDALQLVVALDKNYGLKISDPVQAREILASVNSMAAAVHQARSG